MRSLPTSLVVCLLVSLLAGCGDDTADTTTTTTLGTTTMATTTSTTTTTSTVATTTTTLAPATTTTEAPSLALAPEGLVVIDFGETDEGAVIAAVTAELGAPLRDSGWLVEGAPPACDGPIRQVDWDEDLVIQFTEVETPFAGEGTRHFANYTARTATVATVDGFRVGDTLADLRDHYPASVFEDAQYDLLLGTLVVEVAPGSSGSLRYHLDVGYPEPDTPDPEAEIILIMGGHRVCFD
ncbi:MAG TPA: hypothetical protein VK960_06125 [Acidimicrobiia bacterium]|nr:hypothetical protein [Acidimicrobiia bacterium]